MTDSDLYFQPLLETNALRESLFRSIIQTLQLPAGSHGLDAGCGIGLHTLSLLEAANPKGHITGLDILPKLPAHGTAMVANAGLSRQITFREGDVKHLPFDDNTFDLVWSADCVGHPAGELAPSLRELMRVVKPGGSINLLGWWSQQLLPGHTLIEARLNATCLGYLTFFKDKVPETNFLRVPHWFHHAGLRDIPAPAFVSDIHAPLGTSLRIFLILLLDMRWATPQAETSQADWNPFRRLCDSASSDFVLDAADYCGFFTYTIFRGKVTKE